ncbi:MAG: lipocalin family protein, partial [Trichlorobacter sp.]
KASAVDSPEIGHLKVTFFWPFYSSYIVSYLDPNYQYAVVTGPTLSYTWILARTPRIPNEVKNGLIQHLESIGISKHALIFSDNR